MEFSRPPVFVNPLDTDGIKVAIQISIAKQLIGLHKGKIWVESEVGKGTTFSFSLPQNKKWNMDEKEKVSIKKKILVVEDEEL